jgi:uncharacterized membrane protein YphA (DoxX/SURF4 family)
MFGRAGNEPKLIFPGLAGFYASVADLWYPMIRIVFGASMLFHGWGKVAAGQFSIAPSLIKYGIAPATPLGYVVVLLETIGALCIILGLGTRVFAAGLAIEMAVIAFKVKLSGGRWSCSSCSASSSSPSRCAAAAPTRSTAKSARKSSFGRVAQRFCPLRKNTCGAIAVRRAAYHDAD